MCPREEEASMAENSDTKLEQDREKVRGSEEDLVDTSKDEFDDDDDDEDVDDIDDDESVHEV
jgi:hypothetical protein